MVQKTIRKLKRKTARIIVKNRVYKKCRLTRAKDKARRKRMSCFILTLAFILLVIPGYVFLYHKTGKRINETETLQNQELYSVANIVYRHLNAYPKYCKKAGYLMVSYPKTMITEYEHEIFTLGLEARRKGINPDKMMQKVQRDFSTILQKSITKEFNQIRKREILSKEGKPLMKDEDICRYIDENASEWLKTEKKADVERLKNFVKDKK